jgi:hypothetical protein
MGGVVVFISVVVVGVGVVVVVVLDDEQRITVRGKGRFLGIRLYPIS